MHVTYQKYQSGINIISKVNFFSFSKFSFVERSVTITTANEAASKDYFGSSFSFRRPLEMSFVKTCGITVAFPARLRLTFMIVRQVARAINVAGISWT